MNVKFAKLIAVLLATVMVVMALSGCSGSDGNKDSAETKYKDTITVGAYGEPTSMFVGNGSTIPTIHIFIQMYETLLTMDKDGNIKPLLAESYEQTDDVSYKFTLRKGVKFHNGEEMKASDVVFSLKKTAEIGKVSGFTGAFDVDKFEVVDDYTVILRTKTTYAPFLKVLCHPNLSIYSEKWYTENESNVDTSECGTGAFKLVEWNQDSNVLLTRFDDYWGEHPKYTTLNIRTISEENSRQLELETGGIDIMTAVPGVSIDSIKSNKDLKLYERGGCAVTFLALNFQKDFLAIPEVRQAIAHSIDVDALTTAIKMDAAAPCHSYLAASINGAKLDLKPYDYNTDLAKQLLAKAGYANGLDLKLSYYTSTDNRRIAEIMQSQMAASGINLVLDEQETAAYTPFLNSMEQEAAVTTLNNTLNDPHQTLSKVYSNLIGKGGNRVNYQNPKADALLDAGLAETNNEARMKIYDELQQLLYDDTVWIPIFSEKAIFATSAKIQGFELVYAAAYQNYASVYVVEE